MSERTQHKRPEGNTEMTSSLDICRFGVNYTPSRDWWYCWNDFQPDDIKRDLDAIVKLNADHMRIMLLWPFFQPNPSWVSPAHLERLDSLMEMASERNLDVAVSVFCGHLTGQNFRPGYERRPEDFFESPLMLDAQRHFLECLSGTLNKHDNFLCYDLGNELNCCWSPPALATGDAWHKRSMALAESLSPGKTHVNGVDHQPWFVEAAFSPECLARTQQIVALHCWIEFTGALNEAGGDPFANECVGLPAAMAALARLYAGDMQKPVWSQEFGASEQWMPKATIPAFFERTLLSALHGGIAWHTAWASHDIAPKFNVNPLEYSLGLIDSKQRLKPQGEIFAKVAAEWRGRNIDIPELHIPELPSRRTHESAWRWIRTFIAENKSLNAT